MPLKTSRRLILPPAQRRGALALALAAFSLAVYLGLAQRDHDHLRRASQLAVDGRYERALTEARKVDRAPAEGQALLLRARIAQTLGRHRPAVGLFESFVEREPRSWSARRDLAISLLAIGRRDAARREIEAAAELNPRLPALRGL